MKLVNKEMHIKTIMRNHFQKTNCKAKKSSFGKHSQKAVLQYMNVHNIIRYISEIW